MNLLIKLIIIQLQKEFYKSRYDLEFNYDDTNPYPMRDMLNQINSVKTIISNLFFFEFEIEKKCSCKQNKLYEQNYYLKFELNEEKKETIPIISLFEQLKVKKKCECGKECKIKRKFISLPKYLLLVINDINKNRKKPIKTFLDNSIDIKEFYIEKKKIEYELISFTDEQFIPTLKSREDFKWRKNDSTVIELHKERTMPNLLIYRKL